MSITRTLLIDADDTLWENNIYYERVIAEFVAALGQHGVPAHRAHETLWETEMRNVKITGYGSNAFCQSLHEVARELGVTDLELQISQWENFILHHPIELMTGVRETIPRLHACNRLILLSKGRDDEQLGKLRRSGLEPYFHVTEIVFDKTVATYQSLIANHRLTPSETWMIGNSPRSDINPAKAAGLGTVFIPYHTTWQHEVEEINADGGETLVLETFAQLADHFIKEIP
ncbi:MAG: hypothetical protein FJ395_06155 [Verrucomicrobia bacterium]|nr:hypothetical protein [Verrucomicrobiota bacterium]